MLVIAHRANLHGAGSVDENSYDAIRECLERGFSIETDIRYSPQFGYYLSHDVLTERPDYGAESIFALIRKFPLAAVALDIKELGYERELVGFLHDQNMAPQAFLFDMELLETVPGRTAKFLSALAPDLKTAVRVSDRSESIEHALNLNCSPIVWLDEFDLWAKQKDVAVLKAAGKKVFAVSPDLHGFPREQMTKRWQDFLSWQVDGICTDYPVLLSEYAKKAGA